MQVLLLMNYAIEAQSLMMTTNREAHRAAQAGPALQPAAFPTWELALSFIPVIPPAPMPHTAPLGARQKAYTGSAATLLQVCIMLVPHSVWRRTQRKTLLLQHCASTAHASLHFCLKSCHHLRLAVGITNTCHAVSTARQLWPVFPAM